MKKKDTTINPELTISRFAQLPQDWTGFTSAAALCLVLPIYYRKNFTEKARQTLAAGLDRHAASYNEADANRLINKAEHYLAQELNVSKDYTIGDLREMLRLHIGRLLEGRSREAVLSAVYLATHILSCCGEQDAQAEELWALNEAMLDAKPINATYMTLDGHPDNGFALVKPGANTFGGAAYIPVPIGYKNVLYQASLMDKMLYNVYKEHKYGAVPSWDLAQSKNANNEWQVEFGKRVDLLNNKVYPYLYDFYKKSPTNFQHLAGLVVYLIASPGRSFYNYSDTFSQVGFLEEKVYEEAVAFFESIDIASPFMGVRVLEYILGETRSLSINTRYDYFGAMNGLFQLYLPNSNAHLIATLVRGVWGLSRNALNNEKKYFMRDI